MRIHTLAGDVIDLTFHWPPGTMHVGRQAARLHAQRMSEVLVMRQDPGKAAGWETLVASKLSPDGRSRVDSYAVAPPLTDDERAIPDAELFIRDTCAPMTNIATEAPEAPVVVETFSNSPTKDHINIGAKFKDAIAAALSNENP